MGSRRTYRVAVAQPAARRRRSALATLEAAMIRCRRLPTAGGLARAGRRREAGGVRRRARTGAGRCPGSATPRPGCWCSGSRPAAHGGNRTGRVFTGDRSGDWLFGALHRAGYANQPTSVSADDGLGCRTLWISAAVRCAPPDNKPTTEEFDRCEDTWLRPEVALLGGSAWCMALGEPGAGGWRGGCGGHGPRPPFGHGAEARLTLARRRDRPVAGWSAATTSASRTPSPGGSPSRCSTRCSPAAALSGAPPERRGAGLSGA